MALLETYVIHYLMLIPAISIVILLSLLEKRRYGSDVCWGRPGLIIPVPSLDGYENRLAYSIAYGVTLNVILLVLTGTNSLGFEVPIWAKGLYIVFQALVYCVLSFPYFACISTKYRAVGAVLNIIYCTIWFAIDVAELDDVIKKYDNTSKKSIDVFQRLPNSLCQLALIFYCIYILHRCYRIRSYVSQRVPGAVRPHQVEHVRWVLKKSKDRVYQSLLSQTHSTFTSLMNKSKKLKLFTNLPFFKYPTKLLMVVVLQIVTLYLIPAFVIGYIMVLKVKEMSGYVENVLKNWNALYIVNEISIIFQACVAIALVISILQALLYILMFLRNYRYHMLKLYQGDKHFIAEFKNSPGNTIVSNMNCVGYTFVYFTVGFVFTSMALSVVFFAVAIIIYVCAKLDKISEIFESAVLVLSIPFLGLILLLAMPLACKRVFLQSKLEESDKEPPLNVDNRKLYEVVSYYYLYLSIARGLNSGFVRFILSSAFGFFSMGRMDRSIYARDLQKFDGAYATYVAMLQVDHAHNNPSMRLFAHLLWSEVLVARLRTSGGSNSEIDHLIAILNHRVSDVHSNRKQFSVPDIYVVSQNVSLKSKQARTRWFLAYTLLNNSQFRSYRKKQVAITRQTAIDNHVGLHVITTNNEFSTLA